MESGGTLAQICRHFARYSAGEFATTSVTFPKETANVFSMPRKFWYPFRNRSRSERICVIVSSVHNSTTGRSFDGLSYDPYVLRPVRILFARWFDSLLKTGCTSTRSDFNVKAGAIICCGA